MYRYELEVGKSGRGLSLRMRLGQTRHGRSRTLLEFGPIVLRSLGRRGSGEENQPPEVVNLSEVEEEYLCVLTDAGVAYRQGLDHLKALARR